MIQKVLRQPSVRKMRKLTVESMMHGLANFSETTPRVKKARARTDIIKDVPYREGGHPGHLLDIYRPKWGTGPYPVLLYTHGGGFTLGSKESHRGIALGYANRGYLVFNINYRRAPKHRYPAALEDACSAYAWVVENAKHYGGDIRQMILAGESAGGNLAMGLTIAACYERPEPWMQKVWDTGITPVAVQSIFGMLQASNPGRFIAMSQGGDISQEISNDVSKAYLGRSFDQHLEERELADPLCVFEKAAPPDRPLPPIFAAVGTADILYDDTKRLERAIHELQSTIDAKYYPNEVHGFSVLPWSKSKKQFWRDCFAFLQKYAPAAGSSSR